MLTDVGHIVLACVWIAWCVLHSLMIARRFTLWLRKRNPGFHAWYRLIYVGFSVVSLAPPLLYQRSLPAVTYFDWPFPWSLLQWCGILAGLAVLFAGARQYDQRRFFGLRQLREASTPLAVPPPEEFRTDGILGCIRHPYYSGGILVLLFWGDLTSATLIMKVVLVVYLVAGTFLEERKLLLEYGDAYERYRRRVPMFIPKRFGRC